MQLSGFCVDAARLRFGRLGTGGAALALKLGSLISSRLLALISSVMPQDLLMGENSTKY